MAGRPRTPDTEYEQVASLYEEAIVLGIPPIPHISKVCDVSKTTAASRVGKARKYGFLGPHTSNAWKQHKNCPNCGASPNFQKFRNDLDGNG